jgi:hypothetical protein
MRALFRMLRKQKSSKAAILSAFLLCGLYFCSWYLIARWHNFPLTF